jgi:hypothetical protein
MRSVSPSLIVEAFRLLELLTSRQIIQLCELAMVLATGRKLAGGKTFGDSTLCQIQCGSSLPRLGKVTRNAVPTPSVLVQVISPP